MRNVVHSFYYKIVFIYDLIFKWLSVLEGSVRSIGNAWWSSVTRLCRPPNILTCPYRYRGRGVSLLIAYLIPARRRSNVCRSPWPIVGTQHYVGGLSVRPSGRCPVNTWRDISVHSGAGAPLFPPYPFTSSSFPFFYFSLSFIGFTNFLLLSIPSLSTRIGPLRFQTGCRRKRPDLGLVCVLFCNLCYLYSLVKMDSGVLFYLV